MPRKKVAYWLLNLKLKTALSIGAADSTMTDHDVVLDSRNLPMIPGTSLAGVLRSYFSHDEAAQYFGRLVDDSGGLSEGVVRVYDATWLKGNKAISVRDNVALKNKVAENGLKFDRQAVERGAVFEAHIEVVDTETCPVDELNKALNALACGDISLGGKSSRGMGCVEVGSCYLREFDLSVDSQLEDWLEFDQFNAGCWNRGKDPATQKKSVVFDDVPSHGVTIALMLRPRGAVSVREYSTELNRPDFSQLYVRDTTVTNNAMGNLDKPLIPGTSWAGAFRNRYRMQASSHVSCDGFDATEILFGTVKKVKVTDNQEESGEVFDDSSAMRTDKGADATRWETKTRRSRIEFSESEIDGGGWKEITRNSIDRFTGGTKDGALFTMRTHYAGETKLTIRIRCKDEEWNAGTFEPLIAAIADLHNGFMPVGGLTAVGHGLFEITGATCDVFDESYDGFNDDLLGQHPNGYEDMIVPDVNSIAATIVGMLETACEGSDA